MWCVNIKCHPNRTNEHIYINFSYNTSENDAIINNIMCPIILTICRICISPCTDGLSQIKHKFPLKQEEPVSYFEWYGLTFKIPSPEIIIHWERHLVTYLVNIGLSRKSTLTHGHICRICRNRSRKAGRQLRNRSQPPTCFMF